jgi:hypothetical protein
VHASPSTYTRATTARQHALAQQQLTEEEARRARNNGCAPDHFGNEMENVQLLPVSVSVAVSVSFRSVSRLVIFPAANKEKKKTIKVRIMWVASRDGGGDGDGDGYKGVLLVEDNCGEEKDDEPQKSLGEWLTLTEFPSPCLHAYRTVLTDGPCTVTYLIPHSLASLPKDPHMLDL